MAKVTPRKTKAAAAAAAAAAKTPKAEKTTPAKAPAPVKDTKQDAVDPEEKRKQFIPSDTHLATDLQWVENLRSVLIYNLGMADLASEEVRQVIDSALSSALLLEHDDNSGRAMLRFDDVEKAKEVANKLSGLLVEAQVQHGLGADSNEDIEGLAAQLKVAIPQLKFEPESDSNKTLFRGVLINRELPPSLTEALLRQWFPSAVNVWIPRSRTPNAKGIYEQTKRYAFVQYSEVSEVERALKGFDYSKLTNLGAELRMASFDELRDGTLNPWPVNQKPDTIPLSDHGRLMLITNIDVQMEWVRHSLASTAENKLTRVRHQKRMVERMLELLEKDKKRREAAKLALPESKEQQEYITSTGPTLNELCKGVPDTPKTKPSDKKAETGKGDGKTKVGVKRPNGNNANNQATKKLKTAIQTKQGVKPGLRGRGMSIRARGGRMARGAMIQRGGINMAAPRGGMINRGGMNRGGMVSPRGMTNRGDMVNRGAMNQGRGGMTQGRGSMHQGRGGMNQGRGGMNPGRGGMNPGRGGMNQSGPMMNEGRMSQGGPGPMINQGGPMANERMNPGRPMMNEPRMNQGGPMMNERNNQGGPGPIRNNQGGPGPIRNNQGGPGQMRNQGGPGQIRNNQGGPGPMGNQGGPSGNMNQGNMRRLEGGMMSRPLMNDMGRNDDFLGQSRSSRGLDLPMTNTSIKFDTSYPSMSSMNKPSSLMGGMGGAGRGGQSGEMGDTIDLIVSLKQELQSVTREVQEMREEKSGGNMGGSMGGGGMGGNMGGGMGGNMRGGNMGGGNMGGNMRGNMGGGNMSRGGSMDMGMGGGPMNRGMRGGRGGKW